MKTVYINEQMLGPDATRADADMCIALLRGKGWDALYSPRMNTGRSGCRQKFFDRDFDAVLQEME